MKILQIRFQNLNSLAGEWTIDFTHPDYAANGIFAITGPTGSGKSTLLDAICLAFYGRTPRLERITETTNEIMSRHTGLCSSEVVFDTNKGRFRCHWSQHRAKQQPSGKLQSPRHEIVDDRTDRILETKLKGVARKIVEVTGMDFDQFTRSVLLAQGGFAAFLQASSDERAPILEQITGTGIYSRLSLKVHQRKGEEHQRLALLEAEHGAVSLLTAEEEATIKQDLATKKKSSEESQANLELTQAALTWLTNLHTLQNDITVLATDAEDIARQLRQAEPDKVRLDRARQALALDGSYSQLCRLRILQEKERTEAEKTRREQGAVDLQRKDMLARQKEAQALFHSANMAYQQELALCKEVRELDIKLREAGTRMTGVLLERTAAEEELKPHAGLHQEIQRTIAAKKKDLEETGEYLLLHAKDAALLEDLAGLQELVKTVAGRTEKANVLRQELVAAKEAVRATTEITRQATKTHLKNCRSHADAHTKHQMRQQEITGLLAGRDPSVLREELEKMTERNYALETIGRLTRQSMEVKAELEAIAEQRQEAAAHLEECGCQRHALAQRIALQRQMIEKQEQIVLLAGRIRDYDTDRTHLTDGRPCPLCGSTVHPFGTASLVRPDEAEPALRREQENLSRLQTTDARLQADMATAEEKLKQARVAREKTHALLTQLKKEHAKLVDTLPSLPENVEAELLRVEDQRQQCKNLLQDIDRKMQFADAARTDTEQAKDLCDKSIQEMQKASQTEALAIERHKHLEEQCRIVAQEVRQTLENTTLRIAPYGVGVLREDSCGRIISDLSGRQQTWRQQQEQEQRILADLRTLQINLERESTLVLKQTAEIDRIGQQIRLRQIELTALQKSRSECYGDKDPDREEQKAADRRAEAETSLARLSQNLHLLETNRAVLDERLSTLSLSLTSRAEELVQGEQDFLKLLTEKGFTDENDFNAARLKEEHRREITATLENLTKKEVEIKTLLQNRQEALNKESQRRLTELSATGLTRQIEEKTTLLHELQRQIGMLEGRLHDNEEQRKKRHSRMEALERQRTEYGRWQRLHELIGSSDGKKFRNFAQGVTFDMMVGYANRSLRKMTDRYILIRDTLQPLELNVVDNYQAGEVRSTKNLSGGESFIVSLALALGLAGMAGKNVRVDSLFLDEGFGTLDEDSLETALECLAGLQQDGKIIGIISHVPALRERIATRIHVSPGPAGRSRLQGPGINCGQERN